MSTGHLGWDLHARWVRSISAESDGSVCYATRPGSSQAFNLGRWPTREEALEHGRAYVDRRAGALSALIEGSAGLVLATSCANLWRTEPALLASPERHRPPEESPNMMLLMSNRPPFAPSDRNAAIAARRPQGR